MIPPLPSLADVGTCDQPLDPDNTALYIVWGVGGLGSTAFRHFLRAQAGDAPLHLGRTPQDTCGTTSLSCTTCPPYQGQRIIARDNATFRAVIGPSGSNRGYTSIAGEMRTYSTTHTTLSPMHTQVCLVGALLGI